MASPRSGHFRIVLVTAPDVRVARRLAKAALSARLVACANLLPQIESHYRWKGRVERGAEVLVLMKTTSPKLQALEKLIVSEHPYDTPEFRVLQVPRGNRRYLSWLESSVA